MGIIFILRAMKQTHSRPNDLMSNESQLGVVLFQYDWQNPFVTAVTGNSIWNCIFQSSKSGLKGHVSSLHFQNQKVEPKFGI